MRKPVLLGFVGLSLVLIALIWVEGYTGTGDDGRGNRRPTSNFVYDPDAYTPAAEVTREHRNPEHATAEALTASPSPAASPTVTMTPWPTPETEE